MVVSLYDSPIAAATTMMGKAEQPNRDELADYLRTGGQNLDPAKTAWCAAFVNASLTKSGREGTGQMNARSFLDWGQPVNQPQPGDVAVFSRGDPNGWQGHVGFYQGTNPDGSYSILGGNQGDSVSSARFAPDSLLGFRRDPGAAPQTPGFNPNATPDFPLDALFSSAAPQQEPQEDRAAAEKQRRAALFNAVPGLG
jgi:uncharacterized protein (TIGR02594 family)